MFDNTHIRLSLTHGKKVTSGMSPAFNLYGCTLIVLPEWKPPVYDNTHGITLVTASTRRNSPNNLDSKIHHNNLLNNILAKYLKKQFQQKQLACTVGQFLFFSVVWILEYGKKTSETLTTNGTGLLAAPHRNLMRQNSIRRG
ncbi:branched-chain-amino-acid aminotransferase-like protein 2 isoform X2 [Humulus lupulus]|uniref:branched-chain-amino-acid aminotransferase-like protein 2 isoform X2 n=1 Tax=Humulus lupulus TaxID=3486 RepID=UPI002B41796A|nr:branched-chain-amino-acid aminotransferase-like protein 2 isoform X2 [Humulus lupulus]